MTPLIEILIPTLAKRYKACSKLRTELLRQFKELGMKEDVDFKISLFCDSGQRSIGEKRNHLLQSAKGRYVCFFDDDDMPTDEYIPELMKGIEQGVDVTSLRGVMTTDGENPELFEHSLRYKEYRTAPIDELLQKPYGQFSLFMVDNKCKSLRVTNCPEHFPKGYDWLKYERYPNHLNCMKREIAQQFKFPEINHGEDTDWATQMHKSGLLKTEYYSDCIIYQYLYKSKK